PCRCSFRWLVRSFHCCDLGTTTDTPLYSSHRRRHKYLGAASRSNISELLRLDPFSRDWNPRDCPVRQHRNNRGASAYSQADRIHCSSEAVLYMACRWDLSRGAADCRKNPRTRWSELRSASSG